MMHDVIEGKDVGGSEFTSEEEPSHSLPTPEEVRTAAAIRASESGSEEREAKILRRHRNIGIFGAVLCAVGLIVSLSIFFAEKGTSSIDEENQVREARARAYLSALPIGKPLTDTDSPQSRAMEWIVRDDELRIDIPRSANDESGAKFLERYVLAVLYFSTGGENWNNNMRFLTARESCDWNGYFQDREGLVYLLGALCEGSSEFVTKIWIPTNALNGDLPLEELVLLESIRSLAFEYNGGLEGSLPDNIDDLSNLEVLSLSNNLFTGTLPVSMAGLESLKLLMIDDNEFSGEITPITDLPNLELVYLEDNFFEGEFGENFFKAAASNLVHLDLSDNEFSGTIPARFFYQSRLEVLDLHGNTFIRGELPQIIVEQTNLKVLALHENSISGDIPASIGNLRGLRHLDLSDNELTGYITEAMGDMKELEYLFLGHNPFEEGSIPNFIRDLTRLVDLSLKGTNRINQIPDWIGTDLENLRLLDLDKNRLNGKIPASLAGLKKIVFLLLNRNELTGEVPQEFATAPLEVFVLDNNDLTGDLDFMCYASDTNPVDYLVADCGGDSPEISCTEGDCCRACCADGDGCEERGWIANYDPIWENKYQRAFYSFDDELKWVPTSGGGGTGN